MYARSACRIVVFCCLMVALIVMGVGTMHIAVLATAAPRAATPLPPSTTTPQALGAAPGEDDMEADDDGGDDAPTPLLYDKDLDILLSQSKTHIMYKVPKEGKGMVVYLYGDEEVFEAGLFRKDGNDLQLIASAGDIIAVDAGRFELVLVATKSMISDENMAHESTMMLVVGLREGSTPASVVHVGLHAIQVDETTLQTELASQDPPSSYQGDIGSMQQLYFSFDWPAQFEGKSVLVRVKTKQGSPPLDPRNVLLLGDNYPTPRHHIAEGQTSAFPDTTVLAGAFLKTGYYYISVVNTDSQSVAIESFILHAIDSEDSGGERQPVDYDKEMQVTLTVTDKKKEFMLLPGIPDGGVMIYLLSDHDVFEAAIFADVNGLQHPVAHSIDILAADTGRYELEIVLSNDGIRTVLTNGADLVLIVGIPEGKTAPEGGVHVALQSFLVQETDVGVVKDTTDPNLLTHYSGTLDAGKTQFFRFQVEGTKKYATIDINPHAADLDPRNVMVLDDTYPTPQHNTAMGEIVSENKDVTVTFSADASQVYYLSIANSGSVTIDLGMEFTLHNNAPDDGGGDDDNNGGGDDGPDGDLPMLKYDAETEIKLSNSVKSFSFALAEASEEDFEGGLMIYLYANSDVFEAGIFRVDPDTNEQSLVAGGHDILATDAGRFEIEVVIASRDLYDVDECVFTIGLAEGKPVPSSGVHVGFRPVRISEDVLPSDKLTHAETPASLLGVSLKPVEVKMFSLELPEALVGKSLTYMIKTSAGTLDPRNVLLEADMYPTPRRHIAEGQRGSSDAEVVMTGASLALGFYYVSVSNTGTTDVVFDIFVSSDGGGDDYGGRTPVDFAKEMQLTLTAAQKGLQFQLLSGVPDGGVIIYLLGDHDAFEAGIFVEKSNGDQDLIAFAQDILEVDSGRFELEIVLSNSAIVDKITQGTLVLTVGVPDGKSAPASGVHVGLQSFLIQETTLFPGHKFVGSLAPAKSQYFAFLVAEKDVGKAISINQHIDTLGSRVRGFQLLMDSLQYPTARNHEYEGAPGVETTDYIIHVKSGLSSGMYYVGVSNSAKTELHFDLTLKIEDGNGDDGGDDNHCSDNGCDDGPEHIEFGAYYDVELDSMHQSHTFTLFVYEEGGKSPEGGWLIHLASSVDHGWEGVVELDSGREGVEPKVIAISRDFIESDKGRSALLIAVENHHFNGLEEGDAFLLHIASTDDMYPVQANVAMHAFGVVEDYFDAVVELKSTCDCMHTFRTPSMGLRPLESRFLRIPIGSGDVLEVRLDIARGTLDPRTVFLAQGRYPSALYHMETHLVSRVYKDLRLIALIFRTASGKSLDAGDYYLRYANTHSGDVVLQVSLSEGRCEGGGCDGKKDGQNSVEELKKRGANAVSYIVYGILAFLFVGLCLMRYNSVRTESRKGHAANSDAGYALLSSDA